MISDLNSLERSDVPATPTELMSGRGVKSSLPASGRRSVDLATVRQRRLESQERTFRRLNRRRFSRQEYKMGDRVRVHDPKTKTWRVTITGTRCHEGGNRPVSYLITSDVGAELLRNGKFLRLRRGQASRADSSDGSGTDGERRITFQEAEERDGRRNQQESWRRSPRLRN